LTAIEPLISVDVQFSVEELSRTAGPNNAVNGGRR